MVRDGQIHHRLWQENHIVDYTFSQIDLRVFRISGCWYRTLWLKSIVLALSFVWGFFVDWWVLYTKYKADPDNLLGFFIYLATILISLYILRFEVKEAQLILSTDDVSDCFMNNEANLWKIVKSYDTFCLFQRINAKADCHYYLVTYMFAVIHGGWRLMFVKVPQFILSLVFIRISTSDFLGVFGLKVVYQSYSVLQLLIALLFYTHIRNYIKTEFNIEDFSRFGLPSYVTFLMDKNFNEIINDHRATYDPEAQDSSTQSSGVGIPVTVHDMAKNSPTAASLGNVSFLNPALPSSYQPYSSPKPDNYSIPDVTQTNNPNYNNNNLTSPSYTQSTQQYPNITANNNTTTNNTAPGVSPGNGHMSFTNGGIAAVPGYGGYGGVQLQTSAGRGGSSTATATTTTGYSPYVPSPVQQQAQQQQQFPPASTPSSVQQQLPPATSPYDSSPLQQAPPATSPYAASPLRQQQQRQQQQQHQLRQQQQQQQQQQPQQVQQVLSQACGGCQELFSVQYLGSDQMVQLPCPSCGVVNMVRH
eukprot:gb/GEZN01005892.1/.p1 GENE.gb/GEZN01005892.1/~~gb/GEZN01005892.1/.p1  ORF type:complete len:531 (+),score=92.53 gb/GEZN01005892.1/:17-1609(+)